MQTRGGNCESFPSRASWVQRKLCSLWDKLKTRAGDLNPVDGDQIVNFIANLDQHKMLPLLGGLQLPFHDITTNSIKSYMSEVPIVNRLTS